MKTLHYISIFSLIFTLLLSCGGTQSLPVEDNLLITYERGPCFGLCPVFKMEIDHKGNATYIGKNFTDRKGTFTKKISKDELNALIDLMETTPIFGFSSYYESNIPDLPLVTIGYKNGPKDKTVKGKNDRPEPIMKIEESLQIIVDSDGWEEVIVKESVVDNKENDKKADEVDDREIIKNQMVVEFTSGAIIPRWINSHKDVEMTVQKPLNKERTIWLVQFNPKLISPQVLMHQIQQDPKIKSVEHNYKAEMR